MVPNDREIIALIAYTQPIGLELIKTVVPYDVLEALENRGIITIVTTGWRHDIRLTAQVDQTEKLTLCQLRLRREIAEALARTGLRRRGDHFMLGRFQLDGMVTPDPETLCRAAGHALDEHDGELALRLAEAAIKVGGGFRAFLFKADALASTGKAEAAEQTLVKLTPSTLDETAELAAARARNLFHGLGQTTRARALLSDKDVRHQKVISEIDLCCSGASLVIPATDALMQGRVLTAQASFREALQTSRSRVTTLHSLAGLVEVAALTNRASDIVPLIAQINAHQVEDCVTPADLAPAWLAAAKHDFVGARRLAQEVADRCLMAETVAVQALHLICRFGGAPTAVVERLESFAGKSPLCQAYARHARAMAHNNLAELEQAGEIFGGLGAMLLAAEALAWAGAEYHRRGQLGTAARLAHRADAYLAQCEGARSPCLRLAELAYVPRLTAREQEVSGLALGGLSNLDIAVKLAVSVRTVETHLSRSYHKLGVAGRAGLASMFQAG